MQTKLHYYWERPAVHQGISFNIQSAYDFEDFCNWVLRCVPDALVYNPEPDTGAGDGTGEPKEPVPFEYTGGHQVEISHPDHETVRISSLSSGGPLFLTGGWFTTRGDHPNFVEAPSEWRLPDHFEYPEVDGS